MSRYWYVAHEDELLLDLDDYYRPTRHADATWGEAFFRRRLRDAIRSQKLEVSAVWLVRSQTEGHYQAIVRLGKETVRSFRMPPLDQLIWQMYLGSDLYRSRADLMRAIRGMRAPSLLIMKDKIHGFYREPDRVCQCNTKHNIVEIMQQPESKRCKVWTCLRGLSPWELFGESKREPEVSVPLSIGEVPLADIMSKVLCNIGSE